MANTPPRPPINKRPDEELLEDLCRELRYVAVNEGALPSGERVVVHIHEVCAVYNELDSRRIDVCARLDRLSDETHWQIPPLLADCLAYPERLPYVRDPDGIRRYLRCQLCDKVERPPDAKVLYFCEACMRRVIDSIRQHRPIPRIILFRTFNTECRCSHADGNTVLAQYNSDEMQGVCERCIQDEIERRHGS